MYDPMTPMHYAPCTDLDPCDACIRAGITPDTRSNSRYGPLLIHYRRDWRSCSEGSNPSNVGCE
jgi:hypothetical protein